MFLDASLKENSLTNVRYTFHNDLVDALLEFSERFCSNINIFSRTPAYDVCTILTSIQSLVSFHFTYYVVQRKIIQTDLVFIE